MEKVMSNDVIANIMIPMPMSMELVILCFHPALVELA